MDTIIFSFKQIKHFMYECELILPLIFILLKHTTLQYKNVTLKC